MNGGETLTDGVVRSWIVKAGVVLLPILAANPSLGEEAMLGFAQYSVVWQRMEKITSGRIEITRLVLRHGVSGVVVPQQTSYVVEFSGKKIKFESQSDAFIASKEDDFKGLMTASDRADRLNELLTAGALKREPRKMIYVETENRNYLYLHSDQLQLNGRADMSRKAVEWFDPRTLGLRAAPKPETVTSGGVRINQVTIQTIENQPVMRVEFISSSGVRIDTGVRTTVYINQQDATITRIESGVSGDMHGVTEIQYRKDPGSGVIYPVQVSTKNYLGPRVTNEEVWSVTKAILNSPIDDAEFSPQRLGMGKDAMVIDQASRRLLARWDGAAFVRAGNKAMDPDAMDIINGKAASRPAQ